MPEVSIDVEVLCEKHREKLGAEVIRGDELYVEVCERCLEEASEKAHDEGYEEGFRNGYKAGINKVAIDE